MCAVLWQELSGNAIHGDSTAISAAGKHALIAQFALKQPKNTTIEFSE